MFFFVTTVPCNRLLRWSNADCILHLLLRITCKVRWGFGFGWCWGFPSPFYWYISNNSLIHDLHHAKHVVICVPKKLLKALQTAVFFSLGGKTVVVTQFQAALQTGPDQDILLPEVKGKITSPNPVYVQKPTDQQFSRPSTLVMGLHSPLDPSVTV